jgi:hypothetical protein
MSLRKSIFLISTVAWLAAGSVLSAGEIKVPRTDALIGITFPDDWKVEAEEESVEVTSPDDRLFYYIEAGGAESEASIAESIAYFTERGVKVDDKSVRREEREWNGMKTIELTCDALDERGPCLVSLFVVAVTDEEAVHILRKVRKDDAPKSETQLAEIARSIRKFVN